MSNLFYKITIILMVGISGCGVQPQANLVSPEASASPTPTSTASTLPSPSNLDQEETDTAPLPTPIPPTSTRNLSNIPTPTPEAMPRPTPVGGSGGLDLSLAGQSDTAPITIEIETADGVMLKGTYYPPIQDQAPALLLLHMLGSDRHVWQTFAQLSQAEGYGVLALDLRGHGDSGGERDYAEMDKDVDAALVWLTEQDEIDPQQMGLMGASIGANLALRGGATHDTVQSVILLSAGLNYQDVTTEKALTAYGDRPLLIIAAEEDHYAAQSARQLSNQASGHAQLQIYEGSAHGTNLFSEASGLTKLLLEWLKETL